ncbi:hypothetical protein NQ317_016428 [Molorchus minor]|uniref:Uncharacterized protein n=1 Tax=Molorchus minor TaxID=1323400 RepID=A0ABQ9JZI6_9CUCU|nr:hypothetical protein NQ317_016428 [Molorchus minor]
MVVIKALRLQASSFREVPTPRNDVEDLLHKLEEKVNEGLDKAQQALDAAARKVNETAASVQSAAEGQMQGIEEKLQQKIDELKQKAANAGVNIDDCLAGNEDELTNLPNKFSNDMIHCVSDRVIEGISYAQDALNKVREIVNEVENIRQEIKDCGHGFSSIKCLAKLAIKIEQDVTTLPTKIEADVAATVVLITQLEEKIKDCASGKVSECESQGEAIVERVAACVAAKINVGFLKECVPTFTQQFEDIEEQIQKLYVHTSKGVTTYKWSIKELVLDRKPSYHVQSAAVDFQLQIPDFSPDEFSSGPFEAGVYNYGGEVVGEAYEAVEQLVLPQLTNVVTDLLKKLKSLVETVIRKAHEGVDYAKEKINDLAAGTKSSAEEKDGNDRKGCKGRTIRLQRKGQGCRRGHWSLFTRKGGEDRQSGQGLFRPDERMQDIVNQVSGLEDEIGNCGGGFWAVACYAKVAAKITKAIISFPAEITKDLTSTVAAIVGLTGDVKDCADSNVSKCKLRGDQLFNDIELIRQLYYNYMALSNFLRVQKLLQLLEEVSKSFFLYVRFVEEETTPYF